MEAAEERPNPIKVAAMFRDGLMIALLAARPVRLSNLASIDINRHLERLGEDYWLVFPSEEVKNRRHLEFPLPRSLTCPPTATIRGSSNTTAFWHIAMPVVGAVHCITSGSQVSWFQHPGNSPKLLLLPHSS